MTIHSTLGDNHSEIIREKSTIIYKADLIQYINDFTKIIWCLMQENVIS